LFSLLAFLVLAAKFSWETSRFRSSWPFLISAVGCLAEREEANGRPAVEAPFLSLFTAIDVCAEQAPTAIN
jgi:hypothetical protein